MYQWIEFQNWAQSFEVEALSNIKHECTSLLQVEIYILTGQNIATHIFGFDWIKSEKF